MKRTMLPVVLLIAISGCAADSRQTAPNPASVDPVLATAETILGQPIVYPTGAGANVTAVIVTLPPGAETGWHQHDVPLFGYMLEGELAVDYQGAGQRIYRHGEALMEAIGSSHNGRNLTDAPIRILAVFIGADGVPNTVAAQ